MRILLTFLLFCHMLLASELVLANINTDQSYTVGDYTYLSTSYSLIYGSEYVIDDNGFEFVHKSLDEFQLDTFFEKEQLWLK